jgi:hypothetical protein
VCLTGCEDAFRQQLVLCLNILEVLPLSGEILSGEKMEKREKFHVKKEKLEKMEVSYYNPSGGILL